MAKGSLLQYFSETIIFTLRESSHRPSADLSLVIPFSLDSCQTILSGHRYSQYIISAVFWQA